MQAVLYLRSSRDRAEVSLDAQREALESLASRHGLTITSVFEDAVQSGSSDDRPGFQALIALLKDRNRSFSHILVYDTSRIARNVLIAQVFKRECERRGVRILYATLPADLDPITGLVLHAVFEAFDQMHSMTSRQKGLAGMRQNVLKGWRAGGRAPWGYRLVHESTGGIRDGKPVLKSKLEPDQAAELARLYLKARAAGIARARARREAGVTLELTTLVDVEWNALVYAGHTVWNRHSDKKLRGSGEPRRRAREHWLIQKNTHPALITEVEAEALVTRLESSDVSRAVRAARVADSNYLLAGLLEAEDGRSWVGHAGRHYRLKPCEGRKGRYLSRQAVDVAVLEHFREDLTDDSFIERLCAAAQHYHTGAGPALHVEREAARLERQAERAAQLAISAEDPAPFVNLVARKRREAAVARRQAAQLREDAAAVQAVRYVTPEAIRRLLERPDMAQATLRALVSKVELTPDSRCRLHYKASSPAVASPGGFEPPSPP